MRHPAVAFCSMLDKHLMVGSYDQVGVAVAVGVEHNCYSAAL